MSAVSALFLPVAPALAANAAEIAQTVNALRRNHGVGPLSLDPRLQQAAENQASMMARLDRISHNLGAGQSLQQRVRRVGYPGPAGENLSAGRTSLDAVLQGWMKSPGHRANLLRRDYLYFGLASAHVGKSTHSRYGIYWSMVFGMA